LRLFDVRPVECLRGVQRMIPVPHDFDEDSHIYTVRGVEIPGCTRVIDHGGLLPYQFIRADILERKSKIGREAHRVTALYDANRLAIESVDPRIVGYLDSWIAFRRMTKFVPRLREFRTIANVDGMRYGMTIDAEGYCGSERTMSTTAEIKCTAGIMPHHYIQSAGYALGLPMKAGLTKAFVESAMLRYAARRKWIVILRPNGKPKIYDVEGMDHAEAFLHLLWVATWKAKYKKIYREAA
jgi:hypothetical protein